MLEQFCDDFLAVVPLQLPELLDKRKMEKPVKYDDYVLLTFQLNSPFTIEEVMDILEDEMEMIILYHHIPSRQTEFGHSCCTYSNPSFGRMFKVNGSTDERGMVNQIKVTIYDSLEHMSADVCLDLSLHCNMNPDGKMEYREQVVVFRKEGISHIARVITYVDVKKGKTPKLLSLLTNNFDMPMETVVAIYRRRWQIESLFKQIKQNFPLRYFYGESANAIKIQIWGTMIANLLLSLLQTSLERRWSFSGLATMVRIVMMEYLNMKIFFNMPDADMKRMLEDAAESPPNGEECE